MAVTFDIEKNFISIPCEKDQNLELNLVSWNGRKAKYDLRKWSSDHETMGKGLTMSEDEVIQLFQSSGDVLSALGVECVPDIEEGVGEYEGKLPFED